MIAALASSRVGSGLMEINADFAPRTPIRRKRMQTEFTQASRWSESCGAGTPRPRRAASEFNGEPGDIRFASTVINPTPSERKAESAVESDPRAILRGVDTDASAVAQYVGIVRDVDN